MGLVCTNGKKKKDKELNALRNKIVLVEPLPGQQERKTMYFRSRKTPKEIDTLLAPQSFRKDELTQHMYFTSPSMILIMIYSFLTHCLCPDRL